MAQTQSPREALLWALNDLEENDFKTLKFHLRDKSLLKGQRQLARGKLEGLSRVDLASQLISMYGAQEAVKVVLKVLKVMNLLEAMDQLSHVCLNDYREIYRERMRCLEAPQEATVPATYNQLLLVGKPGWSSSESPNCPILEQELVSVTVNALFDPEERPSQVPPLVVLQGSAGTGKTTLARKMVVDWAMDTLYQDQFDYVFYVSCREVDLLPEGTLSQLLFWCCGDNQAPVTEILRQPERLLFILDGFDELQRPFSNGLKKLSLSPMEAKLRCLIKREVLPTCSLLITTRPLALRNLESLLTKPHHVHVLGFSEDERRRYFSSYFRDEEQARKAFDFVQGNDILYKSCQVPGICWVVCSWLKGQMEIGREFSETPSNDTDIFMAYVSTFLPPSDDGGCSEFSRDRVLRGLCSLAAEGIEHRRFLFEEADLRKHNLDGSSLDAFLSRSDYQEGLGIKKFYSFRHIIFQEFFHAISHLVKEDKNHQGKESFRQVDRLLAEKKQLGDEEMTLSMQFLWDILKKESSSHLELRLCLKIPASIKQDMSHFKDLMESVKHKRAWQVELSLYNSKIKGLVKSLQMSDLSLKLMHSNEQNSCTKSSFTVRTSLNDGQKEEEKHRVVGKDSISGTQKEVSNGKRDKGTRDKEVRSCRMGGRDMGKIELKGQKDGAGERQEDGETE